MLRNKLTRKYLIDKIYKAIEDRNGNYHMHNLLSKEPVSDLDRQLELIKNNSEVKVNLMLEMYKDNFGKLPIDLEQISNLNNHNEFMIRSNIINKLRIADDWGSKDYHHWDDNENQDNQDNQGGKD